MNQKTRTFFIYRISSYSFLTSVRKLFKFLLHNGKNNEETIWNFQGLKIPKKNSCRGNYMRKYGMYKPALILATLRYFTYSWGVHKTLKRSYLLGWTTRVCVLLAHRSPKVMYSKKSIAKMFYYTGWIFSQMLTAMNKAWKKYIYHIISINLNLSTWVYIFIVRYQS